MFTNAAVMSSESIMKHFAKHFCLLDDQWHFREKKRRFSRDIKKSESTLKRLTLKEVHVEKQEKKRKK